MLKISENPTRRYPPCLKFSEHRVPRMLQSISSFIRNQQMKETRDVNFTHKHLSEINTWAPNFTRKNGRQGLIIATHRNICMHRPAAAISRLLRPAANRQICVAPPSLKDEFEILWGSMQRATLLLEAREILLILLVPSSNLWNLL